MKKTHYIFLIIALGFLNLLNAQTDKWSSLGMVKFPTNTVGQPTGIGRVSHFYFHPTDTNTLFAVSASGGLWKTINRGKTWKPMTDNFPQTAMSSACINHKNPNTMYLGTGDANYYGGGMGVWKSYNGGKTWTQSTSGLGNVLVVQMVMHPSDTNTIVITSPSGIYKTTNGGLTWIKKSSVADNYDDMQQRYGSRLGLVVSSRTKVYYSSNFGDNWTASVISTQDTFSGIALATTPADTNLVYAVCWRSQKYNASRSNFGGVFKSVNRGINWKKQSSDAPQILGYNSTGTFTTGLEGQGAYNLAIAVHPKNPNIVFVGAINVWKSTDSAKTWKLAANWAGTGPQTAHADKHNFRFFPYDNQSLFIASDGGIDITSDTGNTFRPISDGLGASEFYKFGQNQLNREKLIGGLQDNGVNMYVNGVFYTVQGGDGTDDYYMDIADSNFTYDMGNGRLDFSAFPGQQSINGITGSVYEMHQKYNQVMYMAKNKVWRTNNIRSMPSAVSWTDIRGTFTDTTGSTIELAQTKKGVNSLYWLKNDGTLYRLDNILSSAPTYTAVMSSTKTIASTIKGSARRVCTTHLDSNVVFIAMNSLVYKSNNKGNSWSQIGTGLPAGVTCLKLICDPKSADSSLYYATYEGVYYKNNSTTVWKKISTSLPSIAQITDMDIFSDSTKNSVIRVSYFGRGIWQCALAKNFGTKPLVDFGIENTTDVCSNANEYILNDKSTGNGVNYKVKWSITPYGKYQYINGTDSLSSRPEVKFLTKGTFYISLFASNTNGTSFATKLLNNGGASVAATCSVITTNLGYYSIGIQRFKYRNINKPSAYSVFVNPNIEDYTCEQIIYAKPNSGDSAWITNDKNYQEAAKIFIDYNNDGDFLDANETVATFPNGLNTRSTFVKIISSPPVVNKPIRLRVVSDYFANNNVQSCGTLQYGQAEDYSLIIVKDTPKVVVKIKKPYVYGISKAIISSSSFSYNFPGVGQLDTAKIRFSNATTGPLNMVNGLNYDAAMIPTKPGKIYVRAWANKYFNVVGNGNPFYIDSTQLIMKVNAFTFPGYSVNDSIFNAYPLGSIKSIIKHGTVLDSLAAQFTLSDSMKFMVSSVNQVSGSSKNNFTSGLTYQISTLDGSVKFPYTVSVREKPLSMISVNSNKQCLTGNSYDFDALLSESAKGSKISQYLWNFGTDASVSTSTKNAVSSVNFSTAGQKTITLIVTDQNGLTDTQISTVTVLDIPTAKIFANSNNQCLSNQNFQFSGTNSIGSKPFKYKWILSPDPNLTTSTDSVLKSISFNSVGQKTVNLTITDINGCFDTANYKIAIGNNPSAQILVSTLDTCFKSNNFSFDAKNSSTVSGATVNSFNWSFGQASPSNATTSKTGKIKFAQVGSQWVKLKVTDSRGCSDSTKVKINVVANPDATFQVAMNKNGLLKLKTTTNQSGLIYKWIIGDTTISNNSDSAQRIFKKTGNYSCSLIVKNVARCSDTSSQSIQVNISSSDVIQLGSNNAFLYPNPASGTLNIQVLNGNLKSISATDITGRLVLDNSFDFDTPFLDISRLIPGVYVFKLEFENGNLIVQKIEKN